MGGTAKIVRKTSMTRCTIRLWTAESQEELRIWPGGGHLTGAARATEKPCLMDALVLSENLAGLRAQAWGLAELAGFEHRTVDIVPRGWMRRLPARLWPAPLMAVGGQDVNGAGLTISVGGKAAAVGAALRRRDGRRLVQVQNPRLALDRFDLVVVNAHDEIDGPNVLVSRTALHGVTQARLTRARAHFAERFAALPRPLVGVLVGGANGRFRFDVEDAAALAGQLAQMMDRDAVSVALTASRRTGQAQRGVLQAALAPRGAFVWDGTGDNPYLGLLACADAFVVTADSVSMVSEAAATDRPVLVAPMRGRSRRIGLFLDGLIDAGRVRPFSGRMQDWAVQPLDDGPWVAAEMRRRLGL